MTERAYFAFWQASPAGHVNTFFFKLTDEDIIAEARSILADTSMTRRHVQGTINQSQAPYNPNWSFHLEPATIGFFERQIEVCDANMAHIDARLDEVGGSFLPHSFWCAWSSSLAVEVTHLVDPRTEKLFLLEPGLAQP
uniref:BP74-related protein n=1 Tax=uncultured Rhizobium sp. TaxID=155567 RepID=UPI0026074A6D|nr:calmodulin [uncultured Rhizobium sp.]